MWSILDSVEEIGLAALLIVSAFINLAGGMLLFSSFALVLDLIHEKLV